MENKKENVMKYIIWILVSAIIFEKSSTTEKYQWLVGPAMVSVILAGWCGMFALFGVC